MNRAAVYVVGFGLLVGALAWIDPLFIPLVLLGPVVFGAVEGWRGTPWTWVAGAWAAGGLVMTVSDWIVNREDVLFHLALTVIMPALALLGWAPSAWWRRRRGADTATAV